MLHISNRRVVHDDMRSPSIARAYMTTDAHYLCAISTWQPSLRPATSSSNGTGLVSVDDTLTIPQLWGTPPPWQHIVSTQWGRSPRPKKKLLDMVTALPLAGPLRLTCYLYPCELVLPGGYLSVYMVYKFARFCLAHGLLLLPLLIARDA